MSENEMTKEDALAFLRAHQPMPDTYDDEACDEETIKMWCAACDYFEEHPCEEAIPLLLNSFGGGDGYEAYQSVESVVSEFSASVFLPYFIKAFKNEKTDKEQLCDTFYGVSYLIKKSDVRSNPELIPSLLEILNNPKFGGRNMVAMTLKDLFEEETLDLTPYKDLFLSLLKTEKDVEVQEKLEEIIEQFE